MKKGCFPLISLLLLCGAALLFTSCETANPATRAQQNPALFQSLSAEDQALVLKGTISEGMSRDVVTLAWGRPDSVMNSSDGGRAAEVWRYTSMRAVYRPYYGVGMGIGSYGRHHSGIYPSASLSMGPDYVPVTSSVVRFRKGRVDGWDTADR